jgi:hypothetical protein
MTLFLQQAGQQHRMLLNQSGSAVPALCFLLLGKNF